MFSRLQQPINCFQHEYIYLTNQYSCYYMDKSALDIGKHTKQLLKVHCWTNANETIYLDGD